MTGQENGALAGKGMEKQKASSEREKGGGPKITEGRGERGEIKGTVKRKNSASSSCSASQEGLFSTPIMSTNREVQLWRRARTDNSPNGSFLHPSRWLNKKPPHLASVFTLFLPYRYCVTLSLSVMVTVSGFVIHSDAKPQGQLRSKKVSGCTLRGSGKKTSTRSKSRSVAQSHKAMVD